MKRNSYIILTAALFCALVTGIVVYASGVQSNSQNTPVKAKTISIKWQRLVGSAGQTCDRCGATQEEVRKAHALLRKSLAPLGIDVVLEEKTLDKATATKNISESNKIWVAGKPLETWLGATTGASDCTSCGSLCGSNVECRTVVVAGSSYESIPSALIVKAGLLAAADIVGSSAVPTPQAAPSAASQKYGVESLGSGCGTSCAPGGCCGK